MTDPTARNRLAEEGSPYLRQHADNPVNWQPWDDEALAVARTEDKPIFLSVGYSACHWCHVMADESFDDEAVATVLNESFVPIKVDREERPDLDRIYQTVCQAVTGGGGWPLSAFLTPEGDPFYIGTYFPREPRRNRPGFLQLCERFAETWNSEQREQLESRGDQWAAAARDELQSVTPPADRASMDDEELDTALDAATRSALRSADREYGGFGSGGPKFPHPGRIDLLLRAFTNGDSEEPLTVAREALDAMSSGGLYDHVGGGFHRYCTDRDWVVPHFEKMLYDNAELPRVYLDAYRLTGNPRYAVVAQETLAFLTRELQHPEGGFFATLAADSAGSEGAYYVWNEETLAEAVTDETDRQLVCDRFGIDQPNFEGDRVLVIEESVESLADDHGMDTETARERLADARARLYDAREDRERPARDEKVIAAWNGLAVSAFAAAGRTLEPVAAQPGVEALEFVRDRLWDGDRLARRHTETDGASGDGYLDDYAFLARGALDIYGVTGELAHLSFALDLGRVIHEAFYDPQQGTIYATPADGEDLIARPQERTDQSTPSGLGVAVSVLLDLAAFAPEAGFEAAASEALAANRDRIRSRPLEHVSLSLAAAKHSRGSLELTLAADDWPSDWREVLASRYLPDALVAPRPATEDGLDDWLTQLGLSEAPPVWANRTARDGTPTAYVCRGFTCSPPHTDLRVALGWAREESAAGDD